MRRLIAVLVLVVALAAAGCGGGGDDGGSKTTATTAQSTEAYAKQLQSATETLQKTFGAISDQTGSNTSSAQIAQRLQKGADAMEQAADKFGNITPPAAAQGAHKKLVEGLHEIAGQLEKAADAARKNDSKTLATALRQLLQGPGAQKLNQATQELKAQGLTPDGTTTTTG
jgi:methyl-accepting chemotaxis protein